jgi:hypothetical protein
MRILSMLVIIFMIAFFLSCEDDASTSSITPPVLNNLVIGNTDSVSITLNQPTFSTTGNPAPTVKAYIGLDGTISVSGNIVSNSIEGDVDVSSGSYLFN